MIENNADNKYVVLYDLRLGDMWNNIGVRLPVELKVGQVIKGKVIIKRDFDSSLPNSTERGIIYVIANPSQANANALEKFFVPMSNLKLLTGSGKSNLPVIASKDSGKSDKSEEKTVEGEMPIDTKPEKLYFGMTKKKAIVLSVCVAVVVVLGYLAYKDFKNKLINTIP